MNLLTGTVTPPPPPPPPVAMPSAPPAAVPAVPPGQERHAAVSKALALGSLSDAALAKQAARFEWVRNALGNAKDKPDLSHDDIVDLVARGAKDGAVPAAEAAKILGGYPTDPAKLREAVQQRHLIAIHGQIAAAGEQQRRAGAK